MIISVALISGAAISVLKYNYNTKDVVDTSKPQYAQLYDLSDMDCDSGFVKSMYSRTISLSDYDELLYFLKSYKISNVTTTRDGGFLISLAYTDYSPSALEVNEKLLSAKSAGLINYLNAHDNSDSSSKVNLRVYISSSFMSTVIINAGFLPDITFNCHSDLDWTKSNMNETAKTYLARELYDRNSEFYLLNLDEIEKMNFKDVNNTDDIKDCYYFYTFKGTINPVVPFGYSEDTYYIYNFRGDPTGNGAFKVGQPLNLYMDFGYDSNSPKILDDYKIYTDEE